MKMIKTIVMASVLLALAACNNGKQLSGPLTVYLAESIYATALQAEVAYGKLPTCGKEVPLPCSKPEIIKKLRVADDAAYAAIANAKAEVLKEGETSDKAKAAIADAVNASNKFSVLTAGDGAII